MAARIESTGQLMGIGAVALLLACTVPSAVSQEAPQYRHTHPIHSLLLEKESPFLDIKWSGQLYLDAPLGNEPAGAQPTLRRAKLKFHRRVGEEWQVKLTANYNKGGEFEVSDSYLVYTGWETALVKFGITTPQFSLESVGGSDALTFMEEALPVAALAERRSGGVGLTKRSEGGIFNASIVALNPEEDGLADSGQALIMRYVHSPIGAEGRADINVGGSFSYRVNANGQDTRLRSRPEIATANTYYVDTGSIVGASEIIRSGLEVNQVRGRFSWQSELLFTRVHRDAAKTVDFKGGYVYASWFLTSDSRSYDLGQGKFVQQQVSHPVFDGGWGAFELAVRASHVDLQDDNIEGGRETNLSLGINWYLSNKLRILGNLVKVMGVDRPGSEFDGSDPLILAARVQWLIQ